VHPLGKSLDGVEGVVTDFARSAWDPSYVGRRSQPYVFTVEAGAVEKVIYAARTEPAMYRAGGGIAVSAQVAPLSFLWTLVNNTPTYRSYERFIMHELPAASAHVHAGDVYMSFHPIFVGDTVAVTVEITGVQEKLGHEGRLVFIDLTWQFANQRSDLAATLTLKAATIYRAEAGTSPAPAETVAAPVGTGAGLGQLGRLDWDALQRGDLAFDVDLGPLTRTAIVQWMGAVDDYATTHYDPDYARERGFPGGQPIASGPHLGSLMLAPVMERLHHDGWVQRFDHRQRRPVSPNDRLRTFGVVSEKSANTIAIDAWLVDDESRIRNTGRFVVRRWS
jgi:acyl dehydratase